MININSLALKFQKEPNVWLIRLTFWTALLYKYLYKLIWILLCVESICPYQLPPRVESKEPEEDSELQERVEHDSHSSIHREHLNGRH